jgi:hypothetical protein
MDELNNDPLFTLGFNDGLEYAAKWITSVLGGYSADVVQFATNNAMSIRAAKRPVQRQDFFDALKNDPEMYSRLQQRAEFAEEQAEFLRLAAKSLFDSEDQVTSGDFAWTTVDEVALQKLKAAVEGGK